MADNVLVREMYPKVEKCFSNPRNVKKYEEIIGKYIDKNSEDLSAIGPTKMILFTDHDMEEIYKLVDISASEARTIKNKSKDIKSTGQNLSNPFYSLMSMIIRYFTIKKNDKLVRLSVLYLGLSLYPSTFSKYYKYGVNENVMNYTVNNLSNKYKIKQTGNLYKALDETFYGAYELHKKNIAVGNDDDVVQLVLAMKTRVNSMMRKCMGRTSSHRGCDVCRECV
jgi:hypothetical protein